MVEEIMALVLVAEVVVLLVSYLVSPSAAVEAASADLATASAVVLEW